MKRIFASAALALALGACADNATDDNGQPVDPGPNQSESPATGKADTAFTSGPMYITGAFDGSKRFLMWNRTVEFARYIQEAYGLKLNFTYFINTCYYDTSVTGSWIGKALSQDEVIVRTALTQQAINEGHEIANHAVRHQDGTNWSRSQWEQEVQEFHLVTERSLFNPILGDDGKPVFPVWEPISNVPGEVGATCETDNDCNTGLCLAIAPDQGFCSDKCNKNRRCPEGSACGASDWNSSTDVCVPLPKFPVEHNGEILFDEEGKANLDHPDLESYPIIGFRAPQLGHNANLFEVLTQFGYRYDTSKILRPGPPAKTWHDGQLFDQIFQFALMRNPGSRTIPMDYNYKVNDASGERMISDYRQSIIDGYNSRNRQPWNIGHHFALWRGGAYWEAMKDAFIFAAEGCPDQGGSKQCEDVLFPSFVELADVLDGKIEVEALRLDDKADASEADIFRNAGADREEENDIVVECLCEEEAH